MRPKSQAVLKKKFCPILGYFSLRSLYNLPIDKTRWLWYNGKARWPGRQRATHKKEGFRPQL